MSLTPRQENFAMKLAEGYSQREAYKFAYQSENMKDSTIDTRAYELFKKSEIKARYEDIKREIYEGHKENAIWTMYLAQENLFWLLNKAKEDIETKGLRQANSTAIINSVKELNTLTDLYPKKQSEGNTLEDREAEKIANALLEIRRGNGIK